MKTLDELQHDLQSIYNELEKIKVAQLSEKDRTMNFKEISSRAERFAIDDHPMGEKDEYSKQMYLLMLLSVAHLDDTAYDDSLLTIYRIAHGMHFEGNVESVFLSAKQMNFDKIDECTRLFLNEDEDDEKLKLLLLLDCMLVTAKFDKGKRQAMEYIADLCSLLKVTKREVTFLGNTARVILTRDLNQYHCDIPNSYSIFECYLNDLLKVEPITIELTKDNLYCSYGWYLNKIEIIEEENDIKLKFTYHRYDSDVKTVDVSLEVDYEHKFLKHEINYEKLEKIVGFPINSSYFSRINTFKGVDLTIGVEYNHLLASFKALMELISSDLEELLSLEGEWI